MAVSSGSEAALVHLGRAQTASMRCLMSFSCTISLSSSCAGDVVQGFVGLVYDGRVFDQLRDALDQIAAVDPDALSDAELHAGVVGVMRNLDRLTVAAAALVQRWDARQVWANDGSKSPTARLARECGSSPRTAGCVLRRARALASMPATAAAGVDGVVSIDKIDLLAAANTTARRSAFTAHEAELVDAIRPLRYAQAVRAVRYWCARVDADIDNDTPPADRDGTLARLIDARRERRCRRGARPGRWGDRDR
jgi:hypothetical protein